MRPRQPPVVAFEEVLPELPQGGTVELTPLLRAVQRADVDVGIFADEEVHLLRDRVDDQPDEFVDAPRLARLSEHDQDVALETALWLLQAQQAATWDDARQAFRFDGVYAVVGEFRYGAEAAVSVRTDVRQMGTSRAATYRVRPDLFLTEDVSETGLHHFMLRSHQRAAAWLADRVDPGHRADRSGPEQIAEHPDQLEPRPDRLAETCETSALVYYGARGDDGTAGQRSFTCY